MHAHNVAFLTAALSLLTLTHASCILHNKLSDVAAQVASGVPTSLCTPAPDGDFTFAMVVSEVSVPTFSAENALAGISGSSGFSIFGAQCNPLGAYGPDDEGNNCGTPYEIDYFDGKPLVVDRIDWGSASAYFRFNFDGKQYTSDGKCNTHYTDGGLRPVVQCTTHFSVGTCTLANIQDDPLEYPETKDALCTTQASGNYQLSLDTRFSTLGLYDADCKSVATYRVGKDELSVNCELPLKIDYFGDSRIITVRKLATDVFVPGWNKDEPAFTFEFNGRSYGSRDDWCSGCEGQGSDGELNQGCKCGFYVGGR